MEIISVFVVQSWWLFDGT